MIWLTHPFQYHQMKGCLSDSHKIVYDCMDNFLEFDHIKQDSAFSNRIFEIERALVQRSNLVITSSRYIKETLIRRYRPSRDPYVVNNALSINKTWSVPPAATTDHTEGRFATISYIGTIATC